MALERNNKTGRFQPMTIEDHIQQHVFPEPNTGCWIWGGATTSREPSYGQLSIKGKTRLAHRVIYQHIKNVELKTEDNLCHKCDNTLCVNPDHIFIGTQADNVRDMVSKKRHTYGENQFYAKLNDEDVMKIRKLKQEVKITNVELAKRYNVTPTAIGYLLKNKTWSHV